MTRRRFRTWVVFPMCFLLINAFEDVIAYKVGQVGVPVWLRVLIVLLMYGVVFALMGHMLTGWAGNVIEKGHATTRRKLGQGGGLLFFCLAFFILYLIYYVIVVDGPQMLLPASWR